VTGQTWPTDEELADYTKAAEIGPATMYLTVARQVAAREKAAAEKALRDVEKALREAAAVDDPIGRVAVWLRARADVLAGEGER
jgi:hypothetical protein